MIENQADVPAIGLTMQEAAQALRIDLKTMRTLIHSGKVKAVKAGKGWRIHPDAIAEWMKAGSPGSTAEETDE